jgi:hypothetical protein
VRLYFSYRVRSLETRQKPSQPLHYPTAVLHRILNSFRDLDKRHDDLVNWTPHYLFQRSINRLTISRFTYPEFIHIPVPMARSFFITRASANSEDPTALEFWPPKGSDELHEALKEAFPFEANLSARMRAAVIEFLLHEQQVEQLVPVSPKYLPSPQSSFISTMPSPPMTSSRTSTDATHSRRQSVGQPSQEALMDVWSLPNKPEAKVHTRRAMTTEEKKAYKQKRLLGACADCKRRRRKVCKTRMGILALG